MSRVLLRLPAWQGLARATLRQAQQGVSTRTTRTAASLAVAPDDDTIKMNLFTAINDAMSIAMRTDSTAIVFGEDVACKYSTSCM